MVIWGVEDIDQTSISNGVDVLAGGVEHSRLAVDNRTTFASLVDHIASSGEVIIAWAGIVTPVVTIVGVLTGASRTAVRLPRLTLKVSLSLEDADICKCTKISTSERSDIFRYFKFLVHILKNLMIYSVFFTYPQQLAE